MRSGKQEIGPGRSRRPPAVRCRAVGFDSLVRRSAASRVPVDLSMWWMGRRCKEFSGRGTNGAAHAADSTVIPLSSV